jgi:hypothetical protein
MNLLSSIHTSGAAATSVAIASADMFASTSASSSAVSATEAPRAEVSHAVSVHFITLVGAFTSYAFISSGLHKNKQSDTTHKIICKEYTS